MATVGQALTAPESGWKRIENNDSLIGYSGSWINGDHGQASSGTETYTSTSGSSISFTFYGTKLRLIGSGYDTGSSSITVSIDGASENASQNSALLRQRLFYEKTSLSEGLHNVRITNNQAANLWFDALDIDDNGYLARQIGQPLSVPDAGWKRYEQSFSGITYLGTGWATETNASHSGGSMIYSTAVGTTQSINFSFFGEKIRIISVYHTSHPTVVNIDIDSVNYQFTLNGTLTYQALAFEKLALTRGLHTVKIWVPTGQSLGPRLDAIDIDADGLLGILPTTTGQPRTELKDMNVGDYIPINYNSATATYSIGTGGFIECPITGMSNSTSRYLYMVKVDNGLLIGDRIITNTISWDALNTAGYIQGVTNGPTFNAIRDFQANVFGTQLSVTGGTVTINGTNDITLTASSTASSDRTTFNRSLGKVFVSFEIDTITKNEFENNVGNPLVAIAITKASPRSNVYMDIGKNGVKIVDNNGSRYVHNRVDFTKFTLYFDDTTSTATIVLDNKYVYRESVVYKADTWSNTTNNQFFMGVKTSATARFKINNVAVDVANTTRDIIPLPNEGRMRALSGGVAYVNAEGSFSASDKSFGAWPINNEWDKYVKGFPIDKLQPGKTADDVFHYRNTAFTWTQDSPFIGTWTMLGGGTAAATASHRIMRGLDAQVTDPKDVGWSATSASAANIGFRPVIEYKEEV